MTFKLSGVKMPMSLLPNHSGENGVVEIGEILISGESTPEDMKEWRTNVIELLPLIEKSISTTPTTKEFFNSQKDRTDDMEGMIDTSK